MTRWRHPFFLVVAATGLALSRSSASGNRPSMERLLGLHGFWMNSCVIMATTTLGLLQELTAEDGSVCPGIDPTVLAQPFRVPAPRRKEEEGGDGRSMAALSWAHKWLIN